MKQAYDALDPEAIEEAWYVSGFGYDSFFRSYLRGNFTYVRTPFGNTRRVEQAKGLRQGGMESPFLFNLVMSHVLGRINAYFGDEVLISYADDLVLQCENRWMMQDALVELGRLLENVGLKVNMDKSELVCSNAPDFNYFFPGRAE